MKAMGFVGWVKHVSEALQIAAENGNDTSKSLRTLGLVVIGAIVFNIACIHQFLLPAPYAGIKDPVLIFAILACLFLTYDVWKKCCGCACCSASSCCGGSASSAGSCCSSEPSSGCCGDKK